MFCAKCGQQISEPANFCGICGMPKYTSPVTSQQQQPVYQQPQPPANQPIQQPVYQQTLNKEDANDYSISNINAKIKFLEAYAQELVRDEDAAKSDLNRVQTFLSVYIELNKLIPPPSDIRLAFILLLLGKPNFAYRNANFVSAEYFNSEFDKAVYDENVDGRGFSIAAVNSCLHGKALSECIENADTTLENANWTFIARHVDAVTRSLGWDGRYDDEPRIALEKRNSKLFKKLHNSGHMLPQTGTRGDIADFLGQSIAMLIENFLQKNTVFSNEDVLFAISGMLSAEYVYKNQHYVNMFGGDLIQACNAAMSSLMEHSKNAPYDIECLMILAFVISMLTGFRPDALVYSTLGEMLIIENDGVPTSEVCRDFGILGYLVGFENWHDMTFGGVLPRGHSNDW